MGQLNKLSVNRTKINLQPASFQRSSINLFSAEIIFFSTLHEISIHIPKLEGLQSAGKENRFRYNMTKKIENT